MRIVIDAPPPWAQSGYGLQAGMAAQALVSLGHEVAISAYAGVHEEREWNGIPVLGTGGKPYGNGVIAFNCRRWKADLLITVTDPWTIDPGQLAGLTVMPWMPVDTASLGVMNRRWLQTVASIAEVHPVAMSKHGRTCLASAGFGAPVVPHATPFAPDPEAGKRWRRELKVPPGAFVIGKVGVNNEDDRKAFGVTLQAFSRFAARHKSAVLYLHTEAQAAKAPNLAMMALELGLKGRVAFADEDRRAADCYSQDDMHAMYCGLDVYEGATKGEGFGCPLIDALACGTPVIGARNSAVTEKVSPAWGRLVDGQGEWARHHSAWWMTPSVTELDRAYEFMSSGARTMRTAAAKAGQGWGEQAMRNAWEKALAAI